MQPIEQSYKNKSYILDNGLSRGYSHMSDIWERDTQQGGLFTYRNLEQGIKSPRYLWKIYFTGIGTIFRFHPRLFSTKLECETTPLVGSERVIVLLSGTGLHTDSSLLKMTWTAEINALGTRFCVNTTLIFILYFKNSYCGLRWTQQTCLLIIHYYGSL